MQEMGTPRSGGFRFGRVLVARYVTVDLAV